MSNANSTWEEGWAGHERAQRRRMAALPLIEKLRWLEEAQELVRQLRRPRPGLVATGHVEREPDLGGA